MNALERPPKSMGLEHFEVAQFRHKKKKSKIFLILHNFSDLSKLYYFSKTDYNF